MACPRAGDDPPRVTERASAAQARNAARGARVARRIATRETLCADVAASGFRVEAFEDRSETLKSWAARFIFAFGSLDALWGGGCAVDSGSDGKARLGYALLIATKSGDRTSAGG